MEQKNQRKLSLDNIYNGGVCKKSMATKNRTLLVLLSVLCLVSIVSLFVFYNSILFSTPINFGGIEIQQQQLDSIVEPLPQGTYVLCSIKDNDCVQGFKINMEDKTYSGPVKPGDDEERFRETGETEELKEE